MMTQRTTESKTNNFFFDLPTINSNYTAAISYSIQLELEFRKRQYNGYHIQIIVLTGIKGDNVILLTYPKMLVGVKTSVESFHT